MREIGPWIGNKEVIFRARRQSGAAERAKDGQLGAWTHTIGPGGRALLVAVSEGGFHG